MEMKTEESFLFTAKENRQKVLEAVARGSEHVRAVLRLYLEIQPVLRNHGNE